MYGANIVAIHPYTCSYETTLLFSEYERRFYDGIKLYGKMFDTAQTLGAKIMSIHGCKHLNIEPEFYCNRFKILSDEAAGRGVTLCQENVRAFVSQDSGFIKDMKEYLGESAAFTLDVKQCLRAGVPVPEMIDCMGDSIKHVHISDSNAASDCLLPFNGGFDFAGLFTLLKSVGYDGNYIIEVYKNAYTQKEEIITAYNKLNKIII
ncbi:MAG: sugar phosphate isomerase/epimerase [Oscillospiraceae bacterium]|nr:sugar phosphate isomerase/epimerase [Candidatus Equicaccousia limihippi]